MTQILVRAHGVTGRAVSVVTPCYNAAHYIGNNVTQVCRQTAAGWEQVVIDDGSTDGSAGIARKAADGHPAVRVITIPNSGVAAARNLGFGETNSDCRYLLFLDADDLLKPDMLATMVNHLDRHPHVGMVYCGFTLIDADGRPMLDDPATLGWFNRYAANGLGVRRLPSAQVETPFEALYTASVLLPSTTLIRRSVYEQTPGFDESFGHLFEDADLFRRLALLADVHRIDQPLVCYRRHEAQSTADVAKMEQQRAKLERKWHNLPGLTDQQRHRVQMAEWFRDYRLGPYLGVRAGWQHLRDGRVLSAARCFGGAARRYALSFVRKPSRP